VATSVYFNNYSSSQEQNLLQDLIAESIKIYGNDMYYLPRFSVNYDGIYGEDNSREYRQAIFLEMYIKSVDGFEGDGTFLSKFNLEIRDQITFSVSSRAFFDEITQGISIERPREGDLIFFPQVKRLFEITYVDKYALFAPLGSLPLFDLKCQLFEYNGEKLDTGVHDIDDIEFNYSPTLNNFSILTETELELTTESGYSLIKEAYDINISDPVADNDELETEAMNFIDFSERDPFSEGSY
jgi:hypothetical protein